MITVDTTIPDAGSQSLEGGEMHDHISLREPPLPVEITRGRSSVSPKTSPKNRTLP